MATYRYINNLMGSRVENFDNRTENYTINATKDGFTIFTKDNEVVYHFDENKNKQAIIHTLDDCIGIEIANRARTHSNFLIFKNQNLLKEASLSGTFANVFLGGEDVYFKKFTGIKGNRSYFKVVNSTGAPVTPEAQVIQHEVNEDDGMDRFYCENYKHLSKEELLKEDENAYKNNLENIAVYLSSGRQLFYQSFVKDEKTSNNNTQTNEEEISFGNN